MQHACKLPPQAVARLLPYPRTYWLWFCCLLAFGVMALPLSPLCRAADDVATGRASAPSAPPDEQVAALLDKLREQVSAGQTTGPTNDNAVETWLQITKLTASNLSPGAARALDDFVHTVHNAETAEEAAGRGTVALDLRVFADFALAELKNRPIDRANSTAASAAATPPQLPSAERAPPTDVRTIDTTAQPPPRGDSTTSIALILAAAPTSVAPPALAETTTQSTVVVDPSLVATYLERGDKMMAIKDISAARKFYEFAARAGNASGAAKLARTYDPDVLHRLGVMGLQPDVAKAIELYREAAALGDTDAQERGRVLNQQAAR